MMTVATKRKMPAAPLYLLRLPSLLSSADLARLADYTKNITFATAFQGPARAARRAFYLETTEHAPEGRRWSCKHPF
jgi:hypothetical protein